MAQAKSLEKGIKSMDKRIAVEIAKYLTRIPILTIILIWSAFPIILLIIGFMNSKSIQVATPPKMVNNIAEISSFIFVYFIGLWSWIIIHSTLKRMYKLYMDTLSHDNDEYQN
jgi:amino acid transporter